MSSVQAHGRDALHTLAWPLCDARAWSRLGCGNASGEVFFIIGTRRR